MKTKLKKILGRTNVVGVIASEDDLWLAVDHPGSIDLFELRADKYAPNKRLLKKLERPLIITVRCAGERGNAPLDPRKRIALYLRYLDLATLIDVEASTAIQMKQVIDKAKKQGVGLIISLHVFESPFDPLDVCNAAVACTVQRGDIFKVAFFPDTLAELGQFITCAGSLEARYGIPVAAMAMGPAYGKVSRLLFGSAKTTLVYGFLSGKVVSGQWKASEIRERLAELVDE
ncbi:MAG: hypothetical protein RLY66_370 [Candidatus Parcubacteria bacterium]|jgi:3-dehydroquinate dehydratase type I